MRTKQDYINGLAKMKRNLYYNGELIDRTDERQMDCINTIGTTYGVGHLPLDHRIRMLLSRYPFLMIPLMLIVAVLIALLLRFILGRRAGRRTNQGSR
jgi:hypothetical protein